MSAFGGSAAACCAVLLAAVLLFSAPATTGSANRLLSFTCTRLALLTLCLSRWCRVVPGTGESVRSGQCSTFRFAKKIVPLRDSRISIKNEVLKKKFKHFEQIRMRTFQPFGRFFLKSFAKLERGNRITFDQPVQLAVCCIAAATNNQKRKAPKNHTLDEQCQIRLHTA
jgi:hypothetical protein